MIALEEFARLLRRQMGALPEQQAAELYRHYELLERWNKKLNLTSIRNAEDAIVRHYCESLFLGGLLPAEAVSVADIGSGAGFPGIPMAVLRPDCKFALIESHQRKAVFLREATRHYPHIQVIAQRAECVEARFDWVVCRAVKPKDVVGSMCRLAPHLGFLAGEDDAAELRGMKEIDWDGPVRLPWGERRVAIVGVSRET